jgi:hypothetical protein
MVDYEMRVYHVQYSTLNHAIARVRTWIKITSSWDCCAVGPSVACRSTPQAPIHRHPGCESRHEGFAQHSFVFHLDPRSLQLALSLVIVHLYISCANNIRHHGLSRHYSWNFVRRKPQLRYTTQTPFWARTALRLRLRHERQHAGDMDESSRITITVCGDGGCGMRAFMETCRAWG